MRPRNSKGSASRSKSKNDFRHKGWLAGSSGHFDIMYMVVAHFLYNNIRWKLSDYYEYYKNSKFWNYNVLMEIN